MKKAVVLLSGGLDSATIIAIAKDLGFNPYALSIFYGQRNHVELEAAKKVADFFKVTEHKFLDLNLRFFGQSSLTDDIEVKDHQDLDHNIVPNTYVPARNTILLSLALAYAEVIRADDIFYGANVHDYSGYPDCRPAYIKAFEDMANKSTVRASNGYKMNIHAPLVDLSKAQIINKGITLGVDYSLTHSCYDPIDDLACHKCSACFYRKKGFLEAGIKDPTRYAAPH